jgi:ElaB/YqjD/DUF883 family membrane-anchored ribosome-binding protein
MAKPSSEERAQADLEAEIATLRADLERLSNRLVEAGSGQFAHFAEEVRDAGERALARAEERLEAGRRKGEEQVVSAQTLIREHPLTAIACALGLGYLIARLQGRD